MTTEVVLEGFDELAKALDGAEQLFQPLATRAMALSLEAIKEAIEVQPAQPSRTRSKHFNTWVRGVGSLPKSAFVADPRQPGGYSLKRRAASFQIKRASERTLDRFHMKVTGKKEITGILHNDSSYSGWVLGPEDRGMSPHQASFHTETGWVSTNKAIAQATPAIEEALNNAVDEFLKGLAK